MPARTVPLTGARNGRSLDDTRPPAQRAPSADLFTDPPRSESLVDSLNTFQFYEWTLEASFKVTMLDHFHGLVGKDGRPAEAMQAPLQLKVRGDDNRLQIEALDGVGVVREVRSRMPVQPNRWYHTVAVCDGRSLRLFLDANDGRGFQLQGQVRFDGPLISSDGTWTVGRGCFNNQIADDARATIDEVRISAMALPPDRWLFSKR